MNAAFWLMVRIGVPDAVLGDIEEQSKHRSRLWLWKQALFAITHTIVRVTRGNPARAVTTVALSTCLPLHASWLDLTDVLITLIGIPVAMIAEAGADFIPHVVSA